LTSMHSAAFRSFVGIVRILLEHGSCVSAKNNDGETPLHLAAAQGREESVRLLIDHGADVQSRDNDGRTPEDWATARHYPPIAAMIQAEAVRREAVRRARCEAFAMGHQERLGAGSRVRWLDAGVVGMVLEYV
jgi:hypothetical protein